MQQRPYLLGAVIGAAVGSAIGYLYFTDAGKHRRDDLARLLDRMNDELKEAQALWARVQRIGQQYQEGRRNALGGNLDFDGPENVQ